MAEVLSENTILGDVLHQWTIREYERHERGTWWHVFMITLGLGLIVYALVTSNFLFALVIVLFGIILYLQSNQHPQDVQFAITDLGILVGVTFYPYADFESFYLIYRPPHVKMLYFDPKGALKPLVRIPLFDENPVELRHTLLEHLNEDLEKEDEPLSDQFARNWKIH